VIGGHEISGVVIETGPQTHDYQVGERLAIAPDVHCGRCYYCQRGLYNLCDNLHFIGISPGCHGGLAEKMLLTREMLENGIIHRMPPALSFAEGALAEPCSSVLACHAMLETSLQDTVVVMGAGPIGCLHVTIAKSRGARVILSEPNPTRRTMAEPFFPDRIVDPSQADLTAIVKEATGGVGADIAVCANPVAATHTQAVELVRKRGKVVLFGGLPKADPITALDANRLHYGEIQVLGSFSYHPTFHALALDVIQRKIVSAEKVITHSLPLAEIEKAFQIAASGDALKVMISMKENL
jgi:L-iditol 2-dehydrogenase